MPQISVSLLLDRTIYATGPVDILDSTLRVKERRTAGQVVGEVDSWIQRGGIVYLSLKPYTRVRLVRVPNANLTLSKADAEAVRLRQKAMERKELQPLRQAEQQGQKEEKGSVSFYLEKYGPVVLSVLAGTYLLGTYIKKKL
jgi:hypothetical protein